MRGLAALAVVGVLVCGGPVVANADETDDLVTRGKKLVDDGKLDEAASLFVSAALRKPSAENHCYAALAFFRLGKLSSSWYHLSSAEAARGETAPPWCAVTLREKLVDGLRGGDYGVVELQVVPPETTISVALDGGDAAFAGPRTLWLPVGTHTIHAVLDDRHAKDVDVTIQRGQTVLTITVPDGTRPAAPQPEIAVPDERSAPRDRVAWSDMPLRRKPRTTGWILLGAGLLAVGTGAVFHVVALDTKSEANDLPTNDPRFDELSDDFGTQRFVAIGGYVVGAALVGTSMYFLFRRQPFVNDFRATVEPLPGGASVGWSWSY